MNLFDPKPTTHFDVMLEKVRGALQEYEDDWRAGLANGMEIRDRQIDEFNAREPLVQEVIRAWREHIAGNHLPAHTSEVRRTIDDLLRACGALAEWKP